ncbi:unnamed protein product [Schistosoma mattheei]|uniref:Uncharacterized protein n=1 Tax=Schistosoma mattheei TaxID=31246 RepID=A0A183PYD4_9TREM|nr:unnamed protein product [Schistosoma mattheei]
MTFNDDTNPIFSNLPFEAHKQILSPNATALKNTVKIEKSMPRKKNVCTEPGSRPNNKNITKALPNKIRLYFPTPCLTLHRGGYKGRLHSNVPQDDHCNHYVSRPNIGQTTVNRHVPRLPSNVLNNKPVRRNFSQFFPIGQDGLLGYSPPTQPHLAGAFLNCSPSQVQQINPLYQNNDIWPSKIPGPTCTTVCSSDSPYNQPNIINHSLCKSEMHNINREAIGFFTLHTLFLNLLIINARSLLNKISALRTLVFLAKPSFILDTET